MAIEPQFILYRFLGTEYAEYYHIAGAFLLICAGLFCLPIKKAFESKPFLMLGRYSMSAYILHFAVLISVTSYLFIRISDKLSYNRSVLIMWLITTAVTYALAIPVKKMLDVIYKALEKGYYRLLLICQ
ncbi:MAG: hypothetical protein NC432_02240 [Roseburia sp.]|nr:hypothetical protein [Roseburia sp.]MCM1097489.1 hypothetical protein [Ruminococcus flavefaciens]